jgi:hypothetical protein
MPHSYAYWLAATEGKPLPELEVGKIEYGFYRQQNRNGGFDAWAIWPGDDGRIWATKNGVEVDIKREDEFAERVFSWICRHPITEVQYREFRKTGRWHDEPPPKPIGHNMGPEGSYEALREEYLGEKAEIEAWLKTDPIKDQGACDRAANWAARIIDLEKRAEAARVKEKEPHLSEARAVDDQWQPVVKGARVLKEMLKKAQEPFLKALADRRATEPQPGARERSPGIKAGTVGSRTSLRTIRKGEITDAEAFAGYLIYVKHPDLMQCLQAIADRIAATKAAAPGMSIREDKRAA